jgi:hypothetical protein
MFVSQEAREKNNVASKNDVLASEEIRTNVETSTAETTTTLSTEARHKSKHNRRHKHGKKDAKAKAKDRKGYQASTAPEDFFKKTYESHFLEVETYDNLTIKKYT